MNLSKVLILPDTTSTCPSSSPVNKRKNPIPVISQYLDDHWLHALCSYQWIKMEILIQARFSQQHPFSWCPIISASQFHFWMIFGYKLNKLPMNCYHRKCRFRFVANIYPIFGKYVNSTSVPDSYLAPHILKVSGLSFLSSVTPKPRIGPDIWKVFPSLSVVSSWWN